MLKADFLEHLRRYFAANRAENDLTEQRIAVMWERFQYEPLTRWRRGVDLAIAESAGRPSASRLETALERAEDEEQRAKIATDRGGGLGTVLSRAMDKAPESFHRATRRTMEAVASGASPAECAELLQSDAFFDPSTDFSRWIAALRSASDWNEMPIIDLLS